MDAGNESFGFRTVLAGVDKTLRTCCRNLVREATQECVCTKTVQQEEEQEVAFKTFEDHSRATNMIQELEALKTGRRLEWSELRDEENKEYTTDERMAEIMQKVALGQTRNTPSRRAERAGFSEGLAGRLSALSHVAADR